MKVRGILIFTLTYTSPFKGEEKEDFTKKRYTESVGVYQDSMIHLFIIECQQPKRRG